MSKKVIIIGAGISGLVSGIYCLKNGFDVCIYEKNSFSGGLLVNSIQKNFSHKYKHQNHFLNSISH